MHLYLEVETTAKSQEDEDLVVVSILAPSSFIIAQLVCKGRPLFQSLTDE